MVRGRLLDDTIRLDSPQLIVVNEALVERHWPEEDPIGKKIAYWDETREIIGVVRNTLDINNETRPMAFMSVLQNPRNTMYVTIRTSSLSLETVRAEVMAIDPDLPIYDVMTMQEIMHISMGGSTIMAKIMSVLGAVAFVLSIVGVYGVIAYSVSQRTQEMGIRLTLGAQRKNLLAMVLGQGTKLAATGIAVGTIIAAGVAKSLSIFLFGVNPYDPLTFGAVTLALFLSGVIATYLPARRATKIDPVDALRHE